MLAAAKAQLLMVVPKAIMSKGNARDLPGGYNIYVL